MRHGIDDGVLIDLFMAELDHRDPIPEDRNAIAAFDNFLDFGGNHQHAKTGFGQFVDQCLDFRFGADIDSSGRFVEDEQFGD